MLIQDSIHTEPVVSPNIESDTTVHISTRPQTPYQVLRLLPKDATPAQQDSAIQAWFQPGEIHYSSEPDTLHLPGHGKGRNLKDVNLPQYYRENFFSKDTLYHEELTGGRFGVAGDPIPYSISSDNVISSLLLGCFVITMLAFSAGRNFILHSIKNFFYIPKTESGRDVTSGEIGALYFFLLQTALLSALLYFLYVRNFVADTFTLSDEYMVAGIIFGVMVGYFTIKMILYSVSNLTFFDSKKNGQWFRAFLFLTAMEGIALYPSTLLLSYFDVSTKFITYYVAITVIFVKILTFYKSFVIFFRQNGLFLQIILYFCALEIIPLFALWGGLEVMINSLKINF